MPPGTGRAGAGESVTALNSDIDGVKMEAVVATASPLASPPSPVSQSLLADTAFYKTTRNVNQLSFREDLWWIGFRGEKNIYYYITNVVKQLQCDMICNNVQVALVAETWLSDKHLDSVIDIDGYRISRRDLRWSMCLCL